MTHKCMKCLDRQTARISLSYFLFVVMTRFLFVTFFFLKGNSVDP